MKALLVAINAKYIHSNLGVYSIVAYQKKYGRTDTEVTFAEYTINQPMDYVMGKIYEEKPDFLAFSCYIWNISYVLELAKELHKVFPDVPIWLGGPEVSFETKQFLEQQSFISGVMLGEGEQTFLDLMESYEEGRSLDTVQGIVYRNQGQIQATSPRPLLNMDQIPFPYEDMELLRNRIVYYESSRGCPFGCSYCLSSVDKTVRLRSMKLVERELQFFLDHKVPQVKFVDRTFNCNREHTKAIWQYIKEHDNGITNFHFELSAELLSDEEIAYVSTFRPGLAQFEIGVQTTNVETMKAIRRPSKLERLQSKVAAIYKPRNIHQHLDLIAGLPEEDLQSFKHSFDDVYRMKPDQLQLGFLKVLKGSPIELEKERYGIVSQSKPPYEVLFTKWLSYADVLHLKRVEEMVERYYNSGQFQATLRFLMLSFASPFSFFDALAKYYRKKGFLEMQQARMRYYEILLAYCREETDVNLDYLLEVMAYDIYERENCKNRPAFLKSQNNVWHWERQYYEKALSEETFSAPLSAYRGKEWKDVARKMHSEQFSFDILHFVQTGEIATGDCHVIFDYARKNPINQGAFVWKAETESEVWQ